MVAIARDGGRPSVVAEQLFAFAIDRAIDTPAFVAARRVMALDVLKIVDMLDAASNRLKNRIFGHRCVPWVDAANCEGVPTRCRQLNQRTCWLSCQQSFV